MQIVSNLGDPRTITKVSKTRTIAGVVCDEYTIEIYPPECPESYVSVKAWYDPQTWVTMRYEEYVDVYTIDFNGIPHVGNRLTFWFEIESIEYGKVKQSDIDAILNEWLKTHTPKDISNDSEHGSDW